MYLASSLEPTGPRSKNHYLILHHDNRRELIKLPKDYLELKKEVQTRFQIDSNWFVETKELNVCAGERIRIPEDLWIDIAELLGNVYIVSRREGRFDSKPESTPVDSRPKAVSDKGVINLGASLVEKEFIVIGLGKMHLEVEPTDSDKINVQVLDERNNSALTIDISPSTGTTSWSSATDEITIPSKEAFLPGNDNYIFIFKQQSSFQLVYNSHQVGTVAAPAYYPLTHVTYDLGSGIPFRGPVSANVYSDARHLRDSCGPYRTLFPQLNKEVLYQQILARDPQVEAKLKNVRREIATFKHSSSGINLRSLHLINNTWTRYEWGFTSLTFLVISYRLTEGSPNQVEIHFMRNNIVVLRIDIHRSPTTVRFYEHTENGDFVQFHRIDYAHRMFAVGDHSIAVMNIGGRVHVCFDFKESTVLPSSKFITWRPDLICAKVPIAQAELFEFVS